MICVVQRVKSSRVIVDEKVVGKVSEGFNILLGVFKGDSNEDINKLVKKIVELRVFNDEQGKMNLSINDVGGSALVVSQFTLAGSIKKGRRPSFVMAEEPIKAKEMYEVFCEELAEFVIVEKGIFAADMLVEINNDGPVTFILDSSQL